MKRCGAGFARRGEGRASTGALLCRYLNMRNVKKSGETFDPTVSFIVPLFNKEEEVVSCIEKLFSYASGYGGFVEIFLIDNGSQDQTYEIAYAAIEVNKRRFPRLRVKLIRLTTRLELSEIVELCSRSALGQKMAIVRCEKGRMKAEVL